MIEGRASQIANRISPGAGFVTLAEIDNQTAIVSAEPSGSRNRATSRGEIVAAGLL